jgi:nicotinamidase-related amidase
MPRSHFRYRTYSNAYGLPSFLGRLQALIDGAKARDIPVVQIFHIEEGGVFSVVSGLVKTIDGLSVTPDAVFHKRSHSALVGSGLNVWLVQHRIRRLIISGEQCCEITARHSSDMSYEADYGTEAMLTFSMKVRNGSQWSRRRSRHGSSSCWRAVLPAIVRLEEALAGAVAEPVA